MKCCQYIYFLVCMTDPCRRAVGRSKWATPYTAESQDPPARSLGRTGSEPHDLEIEPSLISVHWEDPPVSDRKLCRNGDWVDSLLHSKPTIIMGRSYLLPLAAPRAVLFCSWLIFLFRLRRLCRYEVSCDASSFCAWRKEFCSSWVLGHSCGNRQCCDVASCRDNTHD